MSVEEPSPAVFSVPTGTSDSHHGHRRWHKIHGCLVWPPAGAAEAEPSGLFYLHHWLVRCNLVRNWAPLLVEPRGSSNGCGLGSGRTLNFPIPSEVTHDSGKTLPCAVVGFGTFSLIP